MLGGHGLRATLYDLQAVVEELQVQRDVLKSIGLAGWGIRTPEYESLAKSPLSAARWEE